MTCMWDRPKSKKIPFLAIHDDILCPRKHKDAVCKTMDEELSLHFPKYAVVVDHHKQNS